MIELVAVHEPKISMIDTDFENQKRQGKRGLSKFEQVVRKHQIPPPEKPHWFERFLRWWYSI